MSTPDQGAAPPIEQLSAPVRRRSGIGTGTAVAVAVVLLIAGLGGGYVIGYYTHTSSSNNGTGTTLQLTETGSSLLYPLFKYYWFPNYTAPAGGPTVILSAASTGSGAGQSSAENSLVNIGASDAYVLNASATNILDFPVAISSQLVYYNLPAPLNTEHLNLNGTVLAMIYEGTITQWNDSRILAAQTPTVQSQLNGLSSKTIYPFKRTDASGDTFLFTSLCFMSWSGFTYPAKTSGLSGDNIANMQSATGNAGIVSGMKTTPNSIGYIGISYEASAAADGLEYAAIGDNASLSAAGGVNSANYVLPTPQTIAQDANLGLTLLDYSAYGLSVNLILGGGPFDLSKVPAGGGGTNPTSSSPTPYPIVNLEYALFKTAPVSGSQVVNSQNLEATVQFMEWALTKGNFQANGGPTVWINDVGFLPLTPAVIGYDMEELAQVST